MVATKHGGDILVCGGVFIANINTYYDSDIFRCVSVVCVEKSLKTLNVT